MITPLLAFLFASSPVAIANTSHELIAAADHWQEVMNTKNIEQLASYYDDESIVAQLPYKESERLIGLEAIKNMFKNGPFNLKDMNAEVHTIVSGNEGNIGLLMKSWEITYSEGGFQGFAIEVLEKKGSNWIREIDVSAGGISEPSQFPNEDLEKDNEAFDGAVSKLKQAQAIYADSAATQLRLDAKSVEFNNLVAIENHDIGFLLTEIKHANRSYLAFSSLQKEGSEWSIKNSIVTSE